MNVFLFVKQASQFLFNAALLVLSHQLMSCIFTQILNREERVAFIGISNWALDPAKMNRGIMVTRTDPDVAELELSARLTHEN